MWKDQEEDRLDDTGSVLLPLVLAVSCLVLAVKLLAWSFRTLARAVGMVGDATQGNRDDDRPEGTPR